MSKKIKDITELQEFCTPLEIEPEMLDKMIDKINELGSSPQHSSEEIAAVFRKTYGRLKEYES